MAFERDRFYHIEHYDYGEAFTGSVLDHCYRIARDPLMNVRFKSAEEKKGAVLRAWVWKGPYAFRETPEEEKTCRDFDYSEEGLDEAVRWLEEACSGAEPLKLI